MTRRTYRAKLEFLFTMDEKTLPDVKRLVQEHINETYHRMEREDMRITHQTDYGVTDTGAEEPTHEWEFYMNGSFCKRCGAAIGSGVPCR